MHPSCRIMVDGQLVSGVFMSRLISAEVVDREGISSDTVRVELNDSPPAALPRHGAVMRIWMGYDVAGMAFMGAFDVEDVEVEFIPYKMIITGKAAGFKSKGKENKERSWSETTFQAVASDVGKAIGKDQVVVDPQIGSIEFPWVGQLNESGYHFLERLAERNDALLTRKDGKVIIAQRGSGTSPTGASLTPVIVTPENLREGSGRVTTSDRFQYKSVKASSHDRGRAKRTDVEEPSDEEGEAIYRLGDRYRDEAEARRAAKSKAKELKRNKMRFRCGIIGNPAARAGAPLIFQGCRPGIDGIPFLIESATHRYSKRGYITDLDGKLQV